MGKLKKGNSLDIFDNTVKINRKRNSDKEIFKLLEQSKKVLQTEVNVTVDPQEVEFLPDDYDSDQDGKGGLEVDDDDFVDMPRIYFCSRTHSQLSQLVHEIVKSPYQPGKFSSDHLDMAVAALASRKS